VATGTATRVGLFSTIAYNGAGYPVTIIYRVPLRTNPSGLSYWDGAGNATKCSYYSSNAWTDNSSCGLSLLAISAGTKSTMVYQTADTNIAFQWAFDVTLTGG
jgi:hypothetical protein